MPHWAVIALRLIHIVIGVFWAGTVVFMATFLLPSVTGAGPAGGAVMQQLMNERKLPRYLMIAVNLTLFSGLALYWNDSAGFTSKEWLGSGQARVLGLGAILGIIVGILGGAVNAPTAAKIGKLGALIQAAGGPPTSEQAAEMQRLRNRLASAVNAAAVLLAAAVACMAVARYV